MTSPRFGVIGDPHIVAPYHVTTGKLEKRVKILNAIEGLKYVFVTGDIAHQALPSQYELVKSILDTLTAEYFCCTGNHDTVKGIQYEQYSPLFGAPHYSTSIGDYNLLVIEHMRTSNLRDFTVDTSKPAIALKHDAKDPKLIPYFKKHNVKLVIQGHYHKQGPKDEVIEGIRYITCPAYFIGVGTLSNPITYQSLEVGE